MNNFSAWWNRIGLQLRLQILIQGCLIVVLVPAQLWLTHQFRQQVLGAAEGRATEIADGTINGLNTLMIGRGTVGRDSRTLFVEKMGASDRVKELRIVRSGATNEQYGPGLAAEEPLDDMDRSVLASGKPAHRLLDGAKGVEGLRTVLPFIALKNFRSIDCLSCHEVKENTVLGLASVVIDIKEDLAYIEKISAWIWIGHAVLQILLYFAIGFIIRRLVRQFGGEPAYVIDVVKNIAAGNLSQSISTRAGDSTSLLAAVKRLQEERKRVEDQLEQERVQLSDIVAFLPDATLAIDREGRVTIWNRAIEKMTGIPAAQMLGRGDYAYTVPFYGKARPQLMDLVFLDDGELAARYPTIAREGDSLTAEVFCNALYDNRGAWVFAKASPLHDQSGRVIGAIEIVRDITEHKQQEERTRQVMLEMETILRNALVGIAYLKQRRIVSCNRRLEEIFGYEPGELIGETTERLYDTRATFVGIGERAYADLDKSNSYSEEMMLKRKDGSLFWGALNGCAIDPAHPQEGSIWIYSDISARRKAELALEESRERFDLAVRGSSDGIWDWNIESGETYVSERWCEMLGYRPDEIAFGPTGWTGWIHPDDRPGAITQMREHFKTRKPYASEYRMLRKSGEYLWVLNRGQAIWNAQGRAVRVAGSTSDISERKRAEENLELAASVFTHAREGIAITDAEGKIVDVNDTFVNITGYAREEVLGQTHRILSSGRQEQEFYAAMWRDLIAHGHWYGEIWNRRKNGEVYAEMLTISAVRDDRGITRHYVALFSDITPLKEQAQQLEHIAHYDALTTLPNRVLLADRLHQAMAQAQRRGQPLAVTYLDLDGFKAINDNHGHSAGDQLLIALAARMKHALREGDTLARIGGDEFVAVLLDVADIQATVPMLTRLLAAVAQPVHVGELTLLVSASLGVSFYPQAEELDADQLLRQADQAMYQAKLGGKNRYHVFDALQDHSARSHHESLDRIRRALADGEFLLRYQPKVNMRTGKVIGAEALLRWEHPDRGTLLPAVFLPVIEDHALAIALGEWVIDSALTQLDAWHAAGLHIPVSVNIGARQLQHGDFVARLVGILAAHPGVEPSELELEVLETSALEDLARASQVIKDCRAIGVTFALDDFGSGYSSLTYLKRLPITLLKIDQSFVRDILDDPEDLAILEGILSLSAAFQREALAEGVETVKHGTLLLQLGCELAQGYGIAHPMPGQELPAWAGAWRPDPDWLNLRAANREDLPLLTASVEHRAWVRAIEEHLKGEREAPPPLDHRECRLGMWLETEGRARFGATEGFGAIESLHRELHGLVQHMCETQARGANGDAAASLGELHEMRDALLERLNGLEKEIRH